MADVHVTQRLKLPAYGKALLDNRRRGFHPLHVDVLYGDDWREPSTRAKLESQVWLVDGRNARPYEDRWLREVGVPMLALRPREFAPGVFDFRCVTGCAVRVLDVAQGSADFDINKPEQRVTRWGIFYDLVGELAQHAASVEIAGDLDGRCVDMAEFARSWRYFDEAARSMAWPRWWSDEIQDNYVRRNNTWIGAAGYAATRSAHPAAAGA